jgi:hypothetical protein
VRIAGVYNTDSMDKIKCSHCGLKDYDIVIFSAGHFTKLSSEAHIALNDGVIDE